MPRSPYVHTGVTESPVSPGKLRGKMVRNMSRNFVAAVLVVVALTGSAYAASAEGSVPYTDSLANGSITLCDNTGHPVTHGSVNDVPFVWAAVASSPARPPFDRPGRTATLFAFQPRQGVAPQEWNGQQLTTGLSYSDPAHPVAVASLDEGAAFKSFLDSYPPQWNGLVQLRIFLGVPDGGIHNTSYPTADLQVKGDTWTVLRAGDLPCDVAVASLKLAGAPSTPVPGSSSTTGGSGGSTPGTASGGHPGSSSAATGTAQPGISPSMSGGVAAGNGPGSSAAGKNTGRGWGPTVGLVGLGVLILLGAGLVIPMIRRRRAGGVPPA
jgi:hypothetical protein